MIKLFFTRIKGTNFFFLLVLNSFFSSKSVHRCTHRRRLMLLIWIAAYVPRSIWIFFSDLDGTKLQSIQKYIEAFSCKRNAFLWKENISSYTHIILRNLSQPEWTESFHWTQFKYFTQATSDKIFFNFMRFLHTLIFLYSNFSNFSKVKKKLRRFPGVRIYGTR